MPKQSRPQNVQRKRYQGPNLRSVTCCTNREILDRLLSLSELLQKMGRRTGPLWQDRCENQTRSDM